MAAMEDVLIAIGRWCALTSFDSCSGRSGYLLTCEPLAGWRHLAITERRTMPDFAHQMRWLVDVAY